MSNLAKKTLRILTVGGAMFLADGAVCVLCPHLKGITKGLACLASVTIFGSLADQGCTYAERVLEGAMNSSRRN